MHDWCKACIIYLVEVVYIVCKKGRVPRMGLRVPFALVPFEFAQFITNKVYNIIYDNLKLYSAT